MTLQQIATSGKAFPLMELSTDPALAKEIQTKLINLGILDPPADGLFGPLSRNALATFTSRKKLTSSHDLDARLASLLLTETVDNLYPLTLKDDLASRLMQYMEQKKYWFCRVPTYTTIVYVEGMDTDGTINDNVPNQFNDLRLVLSVENGFPKLLGKWEATTEPGRFFTIDKPMNAKGTARIDFGQYKAWCVGTHPRKKSKSAHEGLVQVDTVRVFRDLNKDFKRQGDKLEIGSSFGLDQHWGYDYPKDNIRDASAGCLVGRTKDGHREFMRIVKADPRFGVSKGYKFMTTVVDGADFKKIVG